MKTNYFILCDRLGNLRRTEAGINYLYDWEFAETLTIVGGRPILLMVEAASNQTIVLADVCNNTYKIKVSKIPLSENYETIITKRIKKQGVGYKDIPIISKSVKEMWCIA